LKIMLLGLSKSGTSILAYRLHASLPRPKKIHFEPTSFGQGRGESPDLHRQLCAKPSANLVSKCLIFPQFEPDWNLIRTCAAIYDKRIWIARDPRDRMISDFLYAYYHRHRPADPRKAQRFDRLYEQHFQAIKRKEAEPPRWPFLSLFPNPERVLAKQRMIYAFLDRIHPTVARDWIIVDYRDVVTGQTHRLEQAIGFRLNSQAEVPRKFRRVARSKSYGAWRNWFTPSDVQQLRPLFKPFLDKWLGGKDDW